MSLVGKPAPEFALDGYSNGEFKTYKLSDYKGKWVLLLFYPLDFTFVCPTEVLKFHEMTPKFAEKSCQIFGVSVDSKFSHKAWVETAKGDGGLGGKLAYPLLSDIHKSMARNYDVLIEDAGVALRGLFIIDPDGLVRHATINHLPVGRSAREAMRVLTGFQFVREHGDQVCPADWEEGQETMAANPQGMRDFLKKR